MNRAFDHWGSSLRRTLVLQRFVGQAATLVTNEHNVQECDATGDAMKI